jgi:hypothetical protein
MSTGREEERELIERWRNSDPTFKDIVMRLLRVRFQNATIQLVHCPSTQIPDIRGEAQALDGLIKLMRE